MDERERADWSARFAQWYSVSLPVIEAAQSISDSIREQFDNGLSLLFSFPRCASYVKETRRFCDYMARRNALRKYADAVADDVRRATGRAVDLVQPQLLKKHVGRPTREEAAARAAKEERDRKIAGQKTTTLFGPLSDIQTDGLTSPSFFFAAGTRLHIDQLRWLFPPDLQERSATIRTLRAEAATAATTAKEMAVRGERPAAVAPFAKRAAECTEAYERIYQEIDECLARIYVRLKEDTTFIASIKARRIEPSELRTILRPYWDKAADQEAVRAAALEDMAAADPVQAAARKAREEKEKRAREIIKYLLRKDKPNTPHRIATMRKRMEELASLIGERSDGYRPVLAYAEEDCALHFSDKTRNNGNNE